MLSNFHILTVSHKELPLDQLPSYGVDHLDECDLREKLEKIKADQRFDELYYLSTCNRIVYFFVTDLIIDTTFIQAFFNEQVDVSRVQHKQSEACLSYLFQIASSLHSMVVGEREILKQIKVAYDIQSNWNLTGDSIRLAIQHTIRSAKKVYQSTRIGERPVSIVSLAVQKLLEQKGISKDTSFLLIGAGSTIQLVIKHLSKKGFRKFSVYNRTLEKAINLGKTFQGKAGDLEDLKKHPDAFDCLIACTGANTPIITPTLLKSLNVVTEEVIWMDLGIPGDIDAAIMSKHADRAIAIDSLQTLAEKNMRLRRKEVKKAEVILNEALENFEEIIYRRRIERAFQLIPSEIKSVKQRALSQVFKKELEDIDQETHALISRMMDYMEKKCIGIPMKAAKDAVL